MWRRGATLAVTAAVAVLIGAGAADGSAHRDRSGHGPFDRTYVVAALSTPAGSSPLRALGQVEVSFGSRRVDGRIVRRIGWSAHCNSVGGKLRLDAHRLVPFELVQTLIGCEPAAEREDRWLARFFESRPHWGVQAPRLRLRSSLGTMTLRPRTASPGPP